MRPIGLKNSSLLRAWTSFRAKARRDKPLQQLSRPNARYQLVPRNRGLIITLSSPKRSLEPARELIAAVLKPSPFPEILSGTETDRRLVHEESFLDTLKKLALSSSLLD